MKRLYILLSLILTCIGCKENKDSDASIVVKEDEICIIDEEGKLYFERIIALPRVKSSIIKAHNSGSPNILIDGNLNVRLEAIKMDSITYHTNDSLHQGKDLILILKKRNCKAGEFTLTTKIEGSFFISGEFYKSTGNKWTAKVLHHVEI